MSELLRYSKKIILNSILMIFRIFRIKQNRIVLLDDLAYKYAGNPKYVAEYLVRNYPGEFEIIFALCDTEESSCLEQRGIRTVTYKSLKFFYYAMTATVFLTNSGGISFIPFRKRQYVINTWHGGGAYKKCGIYMYENTFLFRRDLRMSAEKTSVFLSTCSRFTEVMSESMLIPKEKFWEIGMPRNDILLNSDQKIKEKIRKEIGLKPDEMLVLFAPTYRKIDDNYYKDSIAIPYGIDCEGVCAALHKRFGGKWRFGFRLHPTVVNSEELPDGDILNLSDYKDMQELLLVADVMINDFSSSMWDFMLTGKPSFLYAKDLKHYIETTEVYTPISAWPFSKAVNNEELINNILEFKENEYAEACKQHYKDLGGRETGMATQLVCKRISNICKNRLFSKSW